MQRAQLTMIMPAILLFTSTALADLPPTSDPAAPATLAPETTTAPTTDATAPTEPSPQEKLINAMVMRDGEIALPGGKTHVAVGSEFAFLDAKDAKTLLVKIYGNPPEAAEGVLGLLLPKNIHPLAAESWFAVLTYEEDGHVSDDDASSINYDDLLKEMRDATAEGSKEREKAGYGIMSLIGWAQKPSYDKAQHKLFWAKELKFDNAKDNTLNYAIRVLGRTGVLQVNIVAGVNQLKDINPQVPGLLKMVDFTKGQTYADFNESTDQVAAYGLAGLIAGGVAAKAGLFKGLLVLLLASKKLLIALIAGFGASIYGGFKWLTGRRARSEPTKD